MAIGQRNSSHEPEHASPWKLGGLSVKELGKRVGQQMGAEEDDIFGRAAALAYYFFLALFPGLLFLFTVFGFIVGNNPAVGQRVNQWLAGMMPGAASQLVNQTIQQTALHAAGWMMVVGIIGALWSGSGGISSLMTTLNFAYDVKETRPWWKARAISLGLTIATGILILAGILITILGGFLLNQIGGAVGLGGAVSTLWQYGQYVVAFIFVVIAFGLLYRFAPNLKNPKWHWVTPGAVVGVALWVIASIGFRIYLHFFNSYAKTYGSLGAVIVLLLWFYITGLAILIGAEVNAVIEDAAAKHGRADAQSREERQRLVA